MEEKGMFIGVSCALFALRLLSDPEICDERWSEIRDRMLKGSALVGLLVWTVQRNVVTVENAKLLSKLEIAQMEIAELKKRRSEDAKANEKVVSIFSAREQSWFDERRKLSHQIFNLMNDLKVVEAKRDMSVTELGDKMNEIDVILQLKDKMIEDAERRRLESEEKLKAAQDLAEELRESLESHSSEISKHKAAIVEMGRSIRQAEAVVEEKEQLVLVNQRLSVEIVRLHKDLERRSNLDAAEKQMLLKEVRSSKVRRKQAEAEAARWKAVAESKHDTISLRNMFLKHFNPYLTRAIQESRAEQKHSVEMYAVLEQLRQKDEKLEAYNWRLRSSELESRRLQSHIQVLDRDIAHLRQDIAKLEEQLIMRSAPPDPRRLSCNTPGDDTVWSKVKVVKRKPMVKADEAAASENELQDIVLTLEQGQTSTKTNCAWKMDVHALGVSYKVKRLRQQLLVLERLAGKEMASESGESNARVKGFCALMSLLNKQVERYHSLQGKIDQLCKRMQEKKVNNSKCGEDETKRMEHFLEETFQLQRYIVAAGQKLMELQSMIASNLVAEAEDIEKHGSFDIETFGASLKTLFRETQRGIEVRISRIIGDLEGTLARDGFTTWQKL
ncbi:myosin-10-like isoform X2 [Salvia hispanica]|nr:myosin-10-like isoform X2 [Salvia hispanica]XP_047958671.1 myosin-10-like isoform X2 [Salvia hispanica]XP_047958672.1 myosin-10-like isoform X2 [Salvia hispanica]